MQAHSLTLRLATSHKLIAAAIGMLGIFGGSIGVINKAQGSRNEESIQAVQRETEKRVQSLAENGAAVNANLEGLRRDVCRLEAEQNLNSQKIDKNADIFNAKLDRLIERGK